MTDAVDGLRTLIGTRAGDITFLEAGEGPALVLLHGIGSGAGSWAGQLPAFADRFRVVAWDAPGYGASNAVTASAPADFAGPLAAFLDELGIGRCHLVGHSLGALMACAFARRRPERLRSLMVASPAAGYGRADEAVRAERRAARLDLLDELGPEGLARERHGALLSDGAPAAARTRVRAEMARIRPDGYRYAVEALMNGDILADAPHIALPVTVVVGGADRVTPPDGCREVADGFPRARFVVLPGLGHACYVEDPAAFNAVLDEHLSRAA